MQFSVKEIAGVGIMEKLEGFKVYENMDIGNCRINPNALDKINGHPKYAIVIDREYDLSKAHRKMEEEIYKAMGVPMNLLGLYPEILDFCIIIKEEIKEEL